MDGRFHCGYIVRKMQNEPCAQKSKQRRGGVGEASVGDCIRIFFEMQVAVRWLGKSVHCVCVCGFHNGSPAL